MAPLNDFQLFKGRTEGTMKAFGSPVMVHHEAWPMTQNDRESSEADGPTIYSIYRRSEERILQIVKTRGTILDQLAA